MMIVWKTLRNCGSNGKEMAIVMVRATAMGIATVNVNVFFDSGSFHTQQGNPKP